MANKTIGEDFKVYEPAFTNSKRQLEGLSTVQGEKEYLELKRILGDESTGVPAAVSRGTRRSIANYAGEGTADANMPDIDQRRMRAINAFNGAQYQSERAFRDAIVTQGYDNALKLFTSQLGAETEVDLADLQGRADTARANAEMAFQARESELDRILARQEMQTSMSIAQRQQKSERKSKIGGLLGNILGIGGVLAAPFTGGSSILPALAGRSAIRSATAGGY